MAWSTPKTDWDTDDGIMNTDLNRIEGNSLALGENMLKKGISYFANNTTAGGAGYNIRVAGGNLWSQSAVKGSMPGTFDIQKILSSDVWTAGNGAASPCKCPDSQAVGADQWWYVFVLYNPSTGAFDVTMDDNVGGTNISGTAITTAGFTMWKRVACQYEDDSAGNLHDMVGINGYFNSPECGTTTASLSAITVTLVTATDIPPGLSFPCIFQFTTRFTTTPTATYLTAASGLHSSGVVGTVGGFTGYLDAGNTYHYCTVAPNSSDQIYLYSVNAADVRYRAVGWIDDGND